MNPESNQEFYFNLNNVTSDSKYYTVQEFNTRFKNQSNMFSLLHVNSRSLNKNFESFETFLYTLDNFPFSVLGISETWLHSNSPNLFDLQNYKMIRKDREEKRGGGHAF